MLNAFVTYLKESYAEMRRVQWPTREQVKNYTILVVILSITVAIFLGTLDTVFGWALRTFII